jgi:Ti-type conjugative transfer relaxase TraA
VGAFHFTAKIHSRSAGKSAVRSAAYRAGTKLHDERTGKTENYSRKKDVVHAEVFAPEGSPDWVFDRERLWNTVEAREKRKDAQVAQEYEINLPREFSDEENWRLITDFVKQKLAADGRICDVAFHKSTARDGEGHPHVHIMMPLRVLEGGVFTAKHHTTDWRNFFGKADRISALRGDWCEFSRGRAAELGIDLGPDWDHRAYIDRGIDIEAQPKIGGTAQRIHRETGKSERMDEVEATLRRNGECLIADPSLVLQALTNRQATFTDQDLARWIHKHAADDQFAVILERARAAAVQVGVDDRDRIRYSTADMIELESRMLSIAKRLSGKSDHAVKQQKIDRLLAKSTLSEEQRRAATNILLGADLVCLVGLAGAGKSTTLGDVRKVLEADGYTVRGAALSGIAAEKLEQGSGIQSRTLASWIYAWDEGREALTDRDVIVLDEAAMVGTRQLLDLLTRVEKAGAKISLVGDSEQIQAMEAGAAFRGVSERAGAEQLLEVRRQEIGWQREATKELAAEKTSKALERYRAAGSVIEAADIEAARKALLEKWQQTGKDRSKIILAHTNAEVLSLNQAARTIAKKNGDLARDVVIETERGPRHMAEGDRVIFLRNDRNLGVKNGTLATVERCSATSLRARTDDGRIIKIDLDEYRDLDHGYAVTVHKAQGMTVDSTFVLATSGFDRHLTYVALSRHRQEVTLAYDKEEFATPAKFSRTLSRERLKDLAADYIEEFVASRGFRYNADIVLRRSAQSMKPDDDLRYPGFSR